MQGDIAYYIQHENGQTWSGTYSRSGRHTIYYAWRSEAEEKIREMVKAGIWKEGEQTVEDYRTPY